MAHHFTLGAINEKTNSYEFPKFAEKTNKHVCPVCNEQVILCKGKIDLIISHTIAIVTAVFIKDLTYMNRNFIKTQKND